MKTIITFILTFCLTSTTQMSTTALSRPSLALSPNKTTLDEREFELSRMQLTLVDTTSIASSPLPSMPFSVDLISENVASPEVDSVTPSLMIQLTTSLQSTFGWKLTNAISGCIGILLNGLGLLVFFRHTTAWKKVSFYLLINQLAIDFITSIFIASQNLSVINRDPLLPDTIETNDALCRVWYSRSFLWGMLASSYNVAAVTLERYVKVVHSVTYNNRYTRKVAWMLITVIWLIGLIYNLPTLMISSGLTNRSQCVKATLWPNEIIKSSYNYFSIMFQFFIPLLLIIVAYGNIVSYMLKKSAHRPTVSSLHKSGQSSGGAIRSVLGLYSVQKSIFITSIVVTVCFVLCFLPNKIYFLFMNLVGQPLYATQAVELTNFLTTFNCTLNPIVYTWKLGTFHDGIRNMTYCLKTASVGTHVRMNNRSIDHGQVHTIELRTQ